MKSTLLERFTAKYIVDPNTGCWLWVAGKFNDGYGTILGDDGKVKRAHRVAYELYKGPITDGQQVCHRCDVRQCVNPDHLFLGTASDNVQDKVSKGRQAKGEGHGIAKLTESEARAIRYDSREQRAIAKDYGISQNIVGQIKRGELWAHLPGELPPKRRRVHSPETRALMSAAHRATRARRAAAREVKP